MRSIYETTAKFCQTFLLLCSVSLEAQKWQGMKVTLAASTFTQAQLQELQPVADEVTRLVDTLIPGKPQDYPADGIVCFEAPASWKAKSVKPAYSPPITFKGPHSTDEPPEAPANTLRIALDEIPGPNRLSLAFQLAHELAHVKMGNRTDNYLIETFAMALSYEVLHRLGYEGYLLENEGLYLKGLPPIPQEALAWEHLEKARAYWLDASKMEALKQPPEQLSGRSFQTLGAILILRSSHLHWAELLNVSSQNLCSTSTSANVFRVCAPDLPRMTRLCSFLEPLGLASASKRHPAQ